MSSTASNDPPKKSRFADEEGDQDERVSPYTAHRRQALQEDRKSHVPFYPESYPRVESSNARKSVPEFLDTFSELRPEDEVIIMGRVLSKRLAGKRLIFLTLVNEFQKVQVMLNKNNCFREPRRKNRKFEAIRYMIQVGDHICRLRLGTPLAYLAFG